MSASPVTLETQLKLTEWRRKAAEGTLTREAMKDAVRLLRQGREAALVASAVGKRKAAAKVIPNADELLGELDGL
mgnify:CR=1 FL=1